MAYNDISNCSGTGNFLRNEERITMGTTWDELIEQLKIGGSVGASTASDIKALIMIFNYAKENRLKPSGNLGHRLTALREIVAEARKAIKREDDHRLQQLLDMAATKTVKEIRLELGKTDLVEVHVTERMLDGKKRFAVELTEYQLERIVKATELQLKFIIEKEGNE